MKYVINISNLKVNIDTLNHVFVKNLMKSKHIRLTIENPNIDEVDSTFYSYIIEYNKKFDYFHNTCQFKLGISDYQFCLYITSELFDNNTMCYRYKF